MSDHIDLEAPHPAQAWLPAWERGVWCMLLLACTAPLQVLLDRDGRPGTTLLTGAAAAAAAILLFARGGATCAFRLAVASWPYLLIVATIGAFALGAIDRHWSMVRWITWLPCVAVVFCATARLSGPSSTSSILVMLAAAMGLSVAVALAAPSLGVMGAAGAPPGEGSAGAWSGIYRTKNALGHVAGISLALLLAFGRRALGGMVTAGGVIAAALCLVMAGSASGVAIAALLTAFCLLVLQGRGGLRLAAIGVIGVAAGALLLGGGRLAVLAAGLVGRDATLSGRTAIWSAAQPYVLQQPLLGSGYDYTGSPEVVDRLQDLFGVYSVHSGYLDALICLGFGLSGMLFLAIAAALWRAWRRPIWPGDERRAVSTALLLGGLLSAVTEAGVTHPSGPMQLLWLLALFGLYAV